MLAALKLKLGKIFSATMILTLVMLPANFINKLNAQTNTPKFIIDHAQFKFSKKLILLEIYYSLSTENLVYNKVSKGYLANGEIKTYLMTPGVKWENINLQIPDSLALWKKQHKSVTLVDSILIHDFVDSSNDVPTDKEIIEISLAKIKPRGYDILSIFTDLNSNKTVIIKDYFFSSKYSKTKLCLSSLQLASAIVSAKEPKLKFDKNELRIIPNVSRGYKLGESQVDFYAEIYNMKTKRKAQGSTYRVEYSIIDQNGIVVLNTNDESRKKTGSDVSLNGSIDCSELSYGFYKFKIKITDEYTKKSVEAEKNFYIHN